MTNAKQSIQKNEHLHQPIRTPLVHSKQKLVSNDILVLKSNILASSWRTFVRICLSQLFSLAWFQTYPSPQPRVFSSKRSCVSVLGDRIKNGPEKNYDGKSIHEAVVVKNGFIRKKSTQKMLCSFQPTTAAAPSTGNDVDGTDASLASGKITERQAE